MPADWTEALGTLIGTALAARAKRAEEAAAERARLTREDAERLARRRAAIRARPPPGQSVEAIKARYQDAFERRLFFSRYEGPRQVLEALLSVARSHSRREVALMFPLDEGDRFLDCVVLAVGDAASVTWDQAVSDAVWMRPDCASAVFAHTHPFSSSSYASGTDRRLARTLAADAERRGKRLRDDVVIACDASAESTLDEESRVVLDRELLDDARAAAAGRPRRRR